MSTPSASRVAARWTPPPDYCDERSTSFAWIDPKGKVHRVGGSKGHHMGWARRYIAKRPALLRKYPEVDPEEDVFKDGEYAATEALIKEGWIRVVNPYLLLALNPSKQAWTAYGQALLDCLLAKRGAADPEWVEVGFDAGSTGHYTDMSVADMFARHIPWLQDELYDRLHRKQEAIDALMDARMEAALSRVARRAIEPVRLECEARGAFYLMDLKADQFVHFTPAERAQEILRDGKLLMRPPYPKFGIDAVTAVSTVWGRFVPGVQTTHSKGELVAILFHTDTKPEYGYPEEVIWKRDVKLKGAKLIPARQAQAMLKGTLDGQVLYEVPSWCVSPGRVASRYLQAIVVPPRRDREFAMYRIFLKSFWEDANALDDLGSLLKQNEDLLSDSGLDFRDTSPPYWDATRFKNRFENDLGDHRDKPEKEWEDIQEEQKARMYLKFTLEDAQKGLQKHRQWGLKLKDALASEDFKDSVEYYDITPAGVKGLHEAAALAQRLPERVEMLLARMDRMNESYDQRTIPETAQAEDIETLYHASVNAKQLAQKGFSKEMPTQNDSAGLGGSQGIGSGRKGVSFTEDEYVAKEIARVLKEVAMIAHGQVTAKQVLGWAQRGGKFEKVIDKYAKDYAGLNRLTEKIVVDGKQVYLERKPSDNIRAPGVRVPFSEAFGNPVATMGLYLSYLNFSGRYDPKFFGVGGPRGLVKRFKGLNPRDIGYIKAKIDMANPDNIYGKGEREVRVPTEAILSVDKFIG